MKNVLFLNLTAFSKNGGLERFNKCFLKALSELDKEGLTNTTCFSAYDEIADETYFSQEKYHGFKQNKLKFVVNSILHARKHDLIFLGHINLSVIGVIIKKIFPKKKVVLITHGIEVWKELTGNKRKLLDVVDGILSVSGFTKSKLIKINAVPEDKITVFPNTIDPHFPIPENVERQNSMRVRYRLSESDFVLYTLTRLANTEAFKGYDNIFKAIPAIVKEHPNVKYVLAGRYSEQEKERIHKVLNELNITDKVILTGFLDEKVLTDHYQMADLYIMPSKKEGFGIVFLESIVCGVPTVGGNADGTVDALMQGEIGELIDPDSVDDIIEVVDKNIKERTRENTELLKSRKKKTIDNFSFTRYKERLRKVVEAY